MKETVWMVLAGLSIALFMYVLIILGTVLEDAEDTWIGWSDPIPSERYLWENPAGYGLPVETEEYGGLVW